MDLLAQLLELVASILKVSTHGQTYRDDLRGASPRRLVVISLLLLIALCAGIGCLILYFV
ncbi:MAG: hypothetical protein IT313_10670 [Anaerolineales bacterium]|nr:hypothetical protein [Anaerolineales bacterium]